MQLLKIANSLSAILEMCEAYYLLRCLFSLRLKKNPKYKEWELNY